MEITFAFTKITESIQREVCMFEDKIISMCMCNWQILHSRFPAFYYVARVKNAQRRFPDAKWMKRLKLFEPRHEKTCFRPGKTQTGLLSYRD